MSPRPQGKWEALPASEMSFSSIGLRVQAKTTSIRFCLSLYWSACSSSLSAAFTWCVSAFGAAQTTLVRTTLRLSVTQGFLVRFASRPVLAGFTTASALLTIASVVKDLLGVPVARSQELYSYMSQIVAVLPQTSVPTLVTSIIAIGLLLLLPRWRWTRKIPAPLQVHPRRGFRQLSLFASPPATPLFPRCRWSPFQSSSLRRGTRCHTRTSTAPMTPLRAACIGTLSAFPL